MNTRRVRVLSVLLIFCCMILFSGCAAPRTAKKSADESAAVSAKATNADAAAPQLNIGGTWKSAMFGPMTLKQSGIKVTGAYDYNDGQLKGTIEKNRFTFKWWEHVPGQPYEQAFESNRGDGYFDISPDGKKLDGKWRYEGHEEWGGNWSFRKLK
jgi:hypothetical protein